MQTEKLRDIQGERERQRGVETETERDGETETETDRDKDRLRQRHVNRPVVVVVVFMERGERKKITGNTIECKFGEMGGKVMSWIIMRIRKMFVTASRGQRFGLF